MTIAPAVLDEIATGCACFNFRRATRAITQLYDHVLAPSGLRATQLTLLVGLSRSGAVPLTRLAPVLGMDRTTLTRNLGPLERDGLVVHRPGSDRRVTLLEITPKGSKVLAKAIPLWQQAQQQITSGLGAGRWHTLQREIQQVAALAGDADTD
jgi:DNA-binding MarR family transcriptional regulator